VSATPRAGRGHGEHEVTVRSTVRVPTARSTQDLGRELAGLLRQGDLVVLGGPLGAGKTTLTRGIGAGLRVRGAVTSPTFVIARVHPAPEGGPALVHVDAYRLGSLAEIDDLDLDTGLQESVTVVEWGEGLVEDLATDRLEIKILRTEGDAGGSQDPPSEGDDPRTVEIIGHGPRWQDVVLPGEGR
jgi:tRNA threonylcarbamoyladenosine biosynthesis protein TsaE